MVGSRKLSNDEVEALLSGLDEESKDQTAQQFDPNEVREFKFGTEDLSLLGDYYALRMINEKICRFTRSVFLPMLRIMPRISSFPPEVKSPVTSASKRDDDDDASHRRWNAKATPKDHASSRPPFASSAQCRTRVTVTERSGFMS